MLREFSFNKFIHEIKILAENSPVTAKLNEFIRQADFTMLRLGQERVLAKYVRMPVLAATDPWSEVQYQSLYLSGYDPSDRIVLQEPAVKDPAILVVVLKAARLSGQSGLVYCGSTEKLKSFAAKLPEYEKRGAELDEAEMLECLVEAAEADGLKVVFHRLSPEHGGEAEDLED